VGKRRGKGLGGPEPHPELAEEVTGAGGGLAVVQSTAVTSDVCGGTVMDSAHLSPIP
jgi:hypothetical protein